MKVFLDDMRPTPVGWVRTYTVEETMALLETRQVEYLSLDNDLGMGFTEGYVVMDRLEEMVYLDHSFPIPEITVHSSNLARKDYMNQVIRKLNLIRQQQIGGQ
jgi:hypothetical protein